MNGGVVRRLCIVFLAVSGVGFIGEIAIAVSTALPGAPLLPLRAPTVLFPGIFVVHVWSIVLLAPVLRQRRRGWMRGVRLRDFLAATGAPPAALAVSGVYFLAIWLLALLTLTALHGSPSHIGARYYLVNHGSRTPVSRSTYLHAEDLTERAFSLIPSAFYALGVLLNGPRALAGN
jgi:hypothetical protein